MFSYFLSFLWPIGIGFYIFLFTFPTTLLFVHIVLRKMIVSVPQKIGIYLFFLFLTLVIGLVFFPFPDLTPRFCEVQSHITHWRIIPFQFLHDINKFSLDNHLSGIFWILKNQAFYQVFFNFLLLLPLGLFGTIVFRWSFKKNLAFGLLTSFCFEILQGSALFWIFACAYRFFDVDDIMLNMSGMIFGYILARPWRKDITEWMNEKENRIKKNSHFARRLLAYSIDISLIKLPAILLGLFPIIILSPITWKYLNIGLSFILAIVYFVYITHFFHGRTLGKYLFGFKIVDEEDEEKPKKKQLFIRALIPIFSLMILDFVYLTIQVFTGEQFVQTDVATFFYFSIIFIAIPLTIELSHDGRGIHDHLAHTKLETKETGLYKIYLKIRKKFEE